MINLPQLVKWEFAGDWTFIQAKVKCCSRGVTDSQIVRKSPLRIKVHVILVLRLFALTSFVNIHEFN